MTVKNPGAALPKKVIELLDETFDILEVSKKKRSNVITYLKRLGCGEDKDLAVLVALGVLAGLSLLRIEQSVTVLQNDLLADVEQKSALIHSAETSITQSAAQICSAVKEKDSALEKIASVQHKLGASISRLYTKEGRGFIGFMTTALASLAIGMVGVVYLQHNHPEVVLPLTKLVREVEQ